MAPRMSGRKETPSTLQNGVRFAVYAVLSAVSAVLAAVFVFGMHGADGPEDAYFGAGRYLLAAAAILFSGGIVFYREYAKQHPAFASDAWLTIAVGVVTLVCCLILWLSYGGLQPPFALTAYMAINLRIGLLSLLPLPFTVRLFTLIPTRGNATKGFRTAVWSVSLCLAAGLIVLTVCGGLWSMLPMTA